MATQRHLDLFGYRDDPVPNTLLLHDTPATQVGVLLPGFGYTCDMPLFYYATSLLWNQGADVLRVEYSYHRRPRYRESSATTQLDWLLADTRAALDCVSGQPQYQEIILIGKSLGTRAMGYLLTTDSAPQNLRAVWLTPLLGDPVLGRQMQACATPSLTIIGTADPHYDADYLERLALNQRHEILSIQDGDHSLDLAGDLDGSIAALRRVVDAIGALLEK